MEDRIVACTRCKQPPILQAIGGYKVESARVAAAYAFSFRIALDCNYSDKRISSFDTALTISLSAAHLAISIIGVYLIVSVKRSTVSRAQHLGRILLSYLSTRKAAQVLNHSNFLNTWSKEAHRETIRKYNGAPGRSSYVIYWYPFPFR